MMTGMQAGGLPENINNPETQKTWEPTDFTILLCTVQLV